MTNQYYYYYSNDNEDKYELPREPDTDPWDAYYVFDQREWLSKVAKIYRHKTIDLQRKLCRLSRFGSRMMDRFGNNEKYAGIILKYQEFLHRLGLEKNIAGAKAIEYEQRWLSLHWKIESNIIDYQELYEEYNIPVDQRLNINGADV